MRNFWPAISVTNPGFWFWLGIIAAVAGFFGLGPEIILVQSVICFATYGILEKLEDKRENVDA